MPFPFLTADNYAGNYTGNSCIKSSFSLFFIWSRFIKGTRSGTWDFLSSYILLCKEENSLHLDFSTFPSLISLPSPTDLFYRWTRTAFPCSIIPILCVVVADGRKIITHNTTSVSFRQDEQQGEMEFEKKMKLKVSWYTVRETRRQWLMIRWKRNEKLWIFTHYQEIIDESCHLDCQGMKGERRLCILHSSTWSLLQNYKNCCPMIQSCRRERPLFIIFSPPLLTFNNTEDW